MAGGAAQLIRYPAVAPRTRDGQGVGAHKDPGVLTLLWIEPGAGGLEVQRDSAWIEARPVPGSLVVNIGELLEWATDGYLRATVHRVLSPTGSSPSFISNTSACSITGGRGRLLFTCYLSTPTSTWDASARRHWTRQRISTTLPLRVP